MKLKEGLLINKIDNEYVLVDIGLVKPVFNGIMKLNVTSKDIVDLLKDEISEEQIISSLAKKYKMPIKEIKKDVKYVLDILKKSQLLVL